MPKLTDEKVMELIREFLPENVAFKSDGGLHGKCKIEGTLGDVLEFIQEIYWEGYENG